MKKIIFILLLLISCSKAPKEVNTDPLIVRDTISLAPNQRGFTQEVDNPSKGRISVKLDNYTDSLKTFVIFVQEK